MLKLLFILALNSLPILLFITSLLPIECSSSINSLLNTFSDQEVSWFCENSAHQSTQQRTFDNPFKNTQ
ncbi:hypothetical protein ASV53_06415 [Photobacterium sanguinicancri]|uniref:Uncharacterized protein n=1 Tax=Photobacterium sanguinicancri TaxID=875932 RepID=A0ABX4G450_9GAMM|nr:hypothetical protein ASV53_06415 [Photobacterium sanguinicancri]